MRVFHYLSGTADFGIHYGGNASFEFEGFSDADWGSNKTASKSITGYTYLIGKGAVTWSVK